MPISPANKSALPILRSCFIYFAIVALFSSVFLVRLRIERINVTPTIIEDYQCVPSGTFLKHLTFGFDQLIADLFWIKTISYFADHLVSDRKYPLLYHLLDLVTTLDPYFRWPYYFGGIVLSVEAHEVEQSNLILKRAMRYHPNVWKFPFLLGFNYWFYSDKPKTAASYLSFAAQLPQSPRYLKTLPARLYSQAGQKETAIQFLQEILKNTQEDNLRKEIKLRIREIREGKLLPAKKTPTE